MVKYQFYKPKNNVAEKNELDCKLTGTIVRVSGVIFKTYEIYNPETTHFEKLKDKEILKAVKMAL